MAVYTHHLPAWKKDEVEEIRKHAKEYTLIGLVDMYGIPAQQVQQIRRNLRGKAVIKVTRNTLIEHALGEIGGDAKGLTKFISGHSAVIFSNDNPFKLYKQLEKTKTKMAAKAGETAPEDIVIEKGPTSFKPGPIVGELQQAGHSGSDRSRQGQDPRDEDCRQKRRGHLGKACRGSCQA